MENHPRPRKSERKGNKRPGSQYHRGRHEETEWDAQHGHQSGRSGNNYENNDGDCHSQKKRRLQNNNDRSRAERPIGFSYIERLTNNEDLQEVILQLANDKSKFANLLESKEISNDLIILLIKLLWKVCDSTFQNVRIMILSTALQSRFMEKLTMYVTRLGCQSVDDKRKNRYFWDKPDDFWQNLINLSKAVHEIIPTNCEIIRNLLKTMSVFFSIIEGAHSIQISDEIKAQTSSVLHTVEETIESIQVKRRKVDHNVAAKKDMEPPDDFRHIEIIPSVQEIVAKSSPFLRPNIVDRAFNSIDQYLDIQFRLLREDFVAPLRRGINTFLNNQSKAKKDCKKLDDIKVYSPVRFLNVETVNECQCYKLCFDLLKKKRSFTYENSKRFMFGSLVCFTCDNFKTLLFGKIVQRDPELLEQGRLIIGFQDQVQINYEMDYLMVESSVYFEPYYQVLGVLKRMDKENFPMEKYIIRVEADSSPPQYLLKTEPVLYHIGKSTFSPLDFPAEFSCRLNQAQLTAFKAALTEEFCIIQGPPGTGKTYLGLRIAHTLLRNSRAWYNQTPILIICYTNHALDQFLEGIIPETSSILRVGGQSKNEGLKEFNLASKRRHVTSYNKGVINRKRIEVRDFVQRIKTLSNTLNQIELNESIISFDAFKEVVEGYENTWFAWAHSNEIEKWLLEGKGLGQSKRNGKKRQQAQEIHEEEKVEDLHLEDDSDNTAWVDDILINVNVPVYSPLITLNQLRNKLIYLNEKLIKVPPLSACADMRQIISQSNIRRDIWQTETDLEYILYQLRKYEDREGIRMPRNIDLNNPFNIHPEDRWQLYFYWLEKYTVYLRKKYEEESKEFKEVFRVYNEMRDIEDTQLMKQHRVVGMTTTGAARLQSSLQALQSPIVIVEEAAEILEAHIVAALTKYCKHLILIGDHLQLKPGAADYRIETKYKLGISLFERMVNNNIHCYSLNIQHRMKPEISKLIQPHIYQNLVDHESTLQRPPILGVEKSLYFIDHQVEEAVCQDASKKNVHESQFLISLARYLVLNDYKPEQITILAAYLGQFYEMVREKKKPNNRMLLQDVRISVLDNYQGEESDIILLSLVRSNAEDKAGFLKIQNRVCVALSRARDGLYIMGNMSLLLRSNSENQIWEKVNAVLKEQGAIGPNLTLKCQNHPHKITQVAKSEDFMPVNEGGCDLMCERKMVCGHICKRLCHVEDRDHRLKCREKCTRLLCDDPTHKCKKSCYQECGPCSYLMSRDLDCGHKATIECHIDPSEFKCQELIFTKLPCDHEADKPCSVNVDEFNCPHPCDTRVEPCGHACDQQCHMKVDPDHLKYVCRKQCGKSRKGCRKPKNKHRCRQMCYQTCETCEVQCKKKFELCDHLCITACMNDIKYILCHSPCKKLLPCGHPCKNECSATCGPCKVMVKKTIEECQHTVKVQCYRTPTKKDCNSSKCPKLLACGHKCTKPCNVTCTEICKNIVDCNIEAPCGHKLSKIECGLKSSSDAELLLKYCTAPCGVELKCKHKCSGTCGECMQSRIHKRCAEKCGVLLVCNHECPIPCRAACKPCRRQCVMKCPHNKCKKMCGEPCTPCRTDCKRWCPHVQCYRDCGDICEVPPCTQKCGKKLKCRHPCVGFCGDPCPPLCRICNKKELTEIFFGTEDEDDATFVLLNDCKHVLEHSGLSNWLNEGGNQIQFKTCPKCKTNITTTERYSDFVKVAMQDVSLAKTKSIGKPEENEALRKQLLKDLLALRKVCHADLLTACSRLGDILLKLKMLLDPSMSHRRLSINKTVLNGIKSKIQTLVHIINCFKETKQPYTNKDPSIVHLNLLLKVLLRSDDHVTDQEIEDLEFEIKRLHRIVQYDKIKPSEREAQLVAEIKTLTSNIEEPLFAKQRYTNILDNVIKTNLTDLVAKLESSFLVTDKEKIEIVKAIGLEKGHWFKCPKGHPYAIGECGGAMQVAKCDCGEEIGGTNHHLLQSNQLAGEMDNATRQAWPGGLH